MSDDETPRSAEVNLDGSIGQQYHDPIQRPESDERSRFGRLAWWLRVQSLRVGVVGRTIGRLFALALIVQGLWNQFIHAFFEYGTVFTTQRQAIGSLVGAESGVALAIADVLVAAIGLYLFKKI